MAWKAKSLCSPLQSAAGWDYHAKLEQHESQRDHSKGFGGKYGVEKDRVDQVGLITTV